MPTTFMAFSPLCGYSVNSYNSVFSPFLVRRHLYIPLGFALLPLLHEVQLACHKVLLFKALLGDFFLLSDFLTLACSYCWVSDLVGQHSSAATYASRVLFSTVK
jgi:hypothetical protein